MRVVYTCITNDRDIPKLVCSSATDLRFVMFTDNPQTVAPGWEVRPLAWDKDPDPYRVARWHKHHPFELFPDASASIWTDGTHAPILDLNRLFGMLGGNSVAAFRHPTRNRVAPEAAECARLKLDYPQVIEAACERYREIGFPDDRGLFSSAVLVRRHDDRWKAAEELWWSLICTGSRRDQISFPVVLWCLDLHVSVIPGRPRIHHAQLGVPHRPNSFFDVTLHSAGTVAADSTCVLVLGNHRTGSSAVASVLQSLGVSMGGPGDVVQDNPLGQFEDIQILHRHQAMMGERENRKAWQKPKINFADHALGYLKCLWQKSLQPLWGMKDPRLCFLLDRFVESCPRHVSLKFIITERSLQDSVQSMSCRDRLPLSVANQIVRQYQMALVKSLAPLSVPSYQIEYNTLIDNPVGSVRGIAKFLGLPFNEAAAGVVDPSLRHWNKA